MANDKISKDSLNIWLAIGLVIIIGLIVLIINRPFEPVPSTNEPGTNTGTSTDQGRDEDPEEREISEVRTTVENFGKDLKQVSLLAPDASDQIRDKFRQYVSPELLAEWQAKPELAPGRLVSSPMPDRIEIKSVTKQGNGYAVKAEIIETSSNAQESGREIDLILNNLSGRWLITAATLAPYETADGWKNTRNNGLSFQYPEKIDAKYISLQNWPPEIKSEDSADLTCRVEQAEPGTNIRSATINGREYCVRTRSEGAAGSEYRNYDYATIADGRIITASFALRFPQCANYEEGEAAACFAEREKFDLDNLIDRIMRTVRRS